jgi:hypothetical protein
VGFRGIFVVDYCPTVEEDVRSPGGVGGDGWGNPCTGRPLGNVGSGSEKRSYAPRPVDDDGQCEDLEDGLQLMASAASLGLPTLKNGRGLLMKGTCGELRKFKCRNCCLLISKYFSHFEKPASFRVVECHHCQGKADLIENHEDEFDHANAVSAA